MDNDPRVALCGFCKLEGDGLDFVSKRYEVTLGRRSKTTPLDVVLGERRATRAPCCQSVRRLSTDKHRCAGDNMNVSRHHASIKYNFARSARPPVCMHCKAAPHTG